MSMFSSCALVSRGRGGGGAKVLAWLGLRSPVWGIPFLLSAGSVGWMQQVFIPGLGSIRPRGIMRSLSAVGLLWF